MLLKVGELARRSGLTVRTLHHYDAIGLLKPSARAGNGYRLYDRNDIARLHRIQALRRFGLALADIGAYLADPDTPLATIVARQVAMLDQQIVQATKLRVRLQTLQDTLRAGNEPDLSDWLSTLELMTMYDKYFTEDELARMPMYRKTQAPDPEWADLVAEVRAQMDAGVPPESETPRALSVRWMTLLVRDTSGDPRLLAKLNVMHDNEPSMQETLGISTALRDYVLRAFSETKMRIYERYLTAEESRFMRAHYGSRAMEWPQLMADVRDAIDAGIAPDSPQGRELALRWLELFRSYAGDNPATHMKFREALQNEPELMAGTWASEPLLAFVRAAVSAVTPLR
ncbi:MerR family transcriptional regulator [Paraburkholderia phenoliruptrix]|uniref:MerR family transcriptional regulator n=1 Tax=Paraburkholderia phenoliruptrix TaxID=252970 RepID=UPI003D96793C